MGWTNFIVVPKLGLIVETTRDLSVDQTDMKLTDWVKGVLDGSDAGTEEGEEIEDKPCLAITVADMKVLQEALSAMSAILEFTCEDFLLYWLERRGLEYEVMNEYEFKEKAYPKSYIKLRLFEDEGEV